MTTALWTTVDGQLALHQPVSPPAAPGQVQVRTRYSAVIRGAATVSSGAHRTPAAVQDGSVCVGVVEAGPEAWLGRDVACLHPHQTHLLVAAEQLTLLPREVPLARAVLMASAGTALSIVQAAGITPNDRVVVVGAGVVGGLVAHLATAMSASRVTLVDIDTSRRSVADALQVAFAVPDHAPRDCAVVVHTSGSRSGLGAAVACAGLDARVIDAGWSDGGPDTPALARPIQRRRLRLTSLHSGATASATHRNAAIAVLADARLEALITGESDFMQAAQDYPRALADGGTLCHRFVYSA